MNNEYGSGGLERSLITSTISLNKYPLLVESQVKNYEAHMKCTTNFYTSGDVTILNGMTFTVDSDLNGESPQFTLTCISTGGPATTVTWTRDSERVSGMSVLDDPVTAQYTHTLTVTERLGGQYQCTVSNNKPSEDSASFTVQGKREHKERARERECIYHIFDTRNA